MCNQIAVRVHCRQGDEVILEASAHPFHAELGGPAALAGVMMRPIQGERGMFTAEQVRAAIRPATSAMPRARAFWRSRTPATSAAARSGRSRRFAR